MTTEDKPKTVDQLLAEQKAREEQQAAKEQQVKDADEAAARARADDLRTAADANKTGDGVTRAPGHAPTQNVSGDARAAADANANKSSDERLEQAKRETEERNRDTSGVHTVDATSREAIQEQHRTVDEFNERRNQENQEGHQKNMEQEAARADEAQARTKHADDPRAGHVPTGKERNRNTPRVLADGTKVWDQ